MQQKLYFRTDGNTTIGRGHVSRCMAAAWMLSDLFEITFVCLKENVGYVKGIVEEFEVIGIEHDAAMLPWVAKNDIVWLDGYAFTEAWKKTLRALVAKLIETNDIPYSVQNVDIVLNHTPGLTKEMFAPYDPSTVFCLGLDYALLRPKFLEIAQQPMEEPTGEGVFICFGGADTFDLGEKFANGLLEANFSAPIYWVVKSSAQVRENNSKNLRPLYSLNESEMIHYMTTSKIVLIPASVLSFEAIALRKPIFTCWFVENQRLNYRGVTQLEMALGLGQTDGQATVEKMIETVINQYENTSLLRSLIKNQQGNLDGKSKSRIQHTVTL
ncbi:hypothetical protein MWU59_12220 [Flavobacteriaceae bacterium F08102]|nr:hypothetical protein [Flavobacteriaceae bacterium F08102]